MRLVKNILLFLVMAALGLYIFMPKVQLYYKAEQFLKSKNIVISNEKIDSNLLSLKLQHPVIYYQGLDVARAELVEAKPYLVLNSIELKNVETLGSVKRLVDMNIENMDIKQSIFKPFYLKLSANGSFGTAFGYIDLRERKIHIDITEVKDIKPLKGVLKKGKEGWYYESRF